MISEKEALLYAKMPEYKYLLKKTNDFIKYALSKVNNPYIACSFGKDSAVMLHLILNQNAQIPILFASTQETYIIDSFECVIADWRSLFPEMLLNIIYCEREDDGRTHSSEKMSNSIEHDSYFVGIRSDESKARAKSLKFQGKFFKKKDGHVRISPMADWTSKDIMTYIIANKLPLLDTYKEYGETARTTSGVPTVVGKERMLSMLKNRDITAYNKLLVILDGIL